MQLQKDQKQRLIVFEQTQNTAIGEPCLKGSALVWHVGDAVFESPKGQHCVQP